MRTGAIVIYHADNIPDFQIEVRIKDDTVWLNRNQLAALFDRDVKTVGKHINNALREELSDVSVIAKFATTASDGKTYQVEHYNLEMIISVGYRVKSKRGIHFRIWANRILKEYLIKGFVSHHHIERIEKDVLELKEKTQEIEFIVKSNLPPNQGIFFDGQIFDAWQFVSDLIKSASSRDRACPVPTGITQPTIPTLRNLRIQEITRSLPDHRQPESVLHRCIAKRPGQEMVRLFAHQYEPRRYPEKS